MRARQLAKTELRSEGRLFRVEKTLLVGESAPLDYEVASDPYDALLEADNVASCMVQLSDDQIEAICLRYEADLSVSQIARLMERKPNAVSALLHRGLTRLEKLLEPSNEGPLARSKLEPGRTLEDPPPPSPPMAKVIPFRIRRSM